MSLFGITAAFDNERDWRAAIEDTKSAGYASVEAYAPYPDEAAIEAMKLPESRMPMYAFGGGLFGAIGAYYLQYYTAVQQFPLDVGGRALHSWQAFMPITFEGAVLCASISILAGFFFESKFPEPYHPMFNLEAFSQASSHRFFLTILSDDQKFQPAVAREFLYRFSAEVFDVPS